MCDASHVASPGLVDVRALAGGAGGRRLRQGARVQDPLGPSVHGGLRRDGAGSDV